MFDFDAEVNLICEAVDAELDCDFNEDDDVALAPYLALQAPAGYVKNAFYA